ncbi:MULTISPECIES: hypothetical protein [Pseudomonadota]|uniref:hypothetical protein n=1 Tax=Pseudomonadota TaxID=1224 RepID=UPI00261B216F|nr:MULTISPECIES: hypothetical protein [Pseudomonadota]
MEFFITLQDGFGDGVLAEPAAIIEMAHEWAPQKTDIFVQAVAREDGENSLFVEGGYQWHEQVRFFVNVQDSPGEQPSYDESITFQAGVELDMKVVTLTADASPDAFGAGKRVRFGLKNDYQFTPRVSVSSHVKYRYQAKKDNWEPQLDLQVNYKLNPNASVFVKHTEHDFFDDATVLGYKLRAF